MPRQAKPKAPTLAELKEQLQKHTDHIEWSRHIITMQQAEIDRMMTLVDRFTTSLNNISKWNHD